MVRMIKLLTLSVIVLAVSVSEALGKSVTGVAILRQPQAVRELGMGDVGSGLSDDAGGLHYNPAGIAAIKHVELNAMYHQNIVDTRNEAVNLTIPLSKGIFLGGEGGLGFTVSMYETGQIDVIEGRESGDRFIIESEKTVNAETDYQVGVCYSQEVLKLWGKTYAGVMVKWIQAQLVEEYKANAIAVDVGVLERWEKLGLGVVVQNMGTEMKFMEEGDALPLTLRVGGSYEARLGNIVKVVAGIDAAKVTNESVEWGVGGECLIAGFLGFRGGYKINGENKLSLGACLRVKWLQLDYTCRVMDTFGTTHLAGITLRMGLSEKEEEAK